MFLMPSNPTGWGRRQSVARSNLHKGGPCRAWGIFNTVIANLFREAISPFLT